MGRRWDKRVVGFFFFLFFSIYLGGVSYALVGQNFWVNKIVVEGNHVVPTKDITPVITPFEHKKLNLKTLKHIAYLITEIYIKRGYVTSRAYIPPQNIKDGIVRIAVFEGKVGSINIHGRHPYYPTGFIKSYFKPLVKERIFNRKVLERALLLLNQCINLKVKAKLKRGKLPGTTDIDINATSKYPASVAATYDNFASKYTSKNKSRFGGSLNVENIPVPGSIISFYGMVGSRYTDLRFYRIADSFPVGVEGLRLSFYYSYGNYDVGRDLQVLNITGLSSSYGCSVSYPVIKQRTKSLSVNLGLSFVYSKQLMLGKITSRDKIRPVSAGFTYSFITAYSKNFFNFSITQGLGDNLGGMPNGYLRASRVGAVSDFTKFNINIFRIQRIKPYLFFIAKGTGQYCDRVLISSEEFYIGGADSVRGFTQSEYGGDSGYFATAELRIAPLSERKLLQLAIFADTGYVCAVHPASGQKRDHSLTGVGVGLCMDMPYGLHLRADFAVPVKPSRNADGKKYDFYIQLVESI